MRIFSIDPITAHCKRLVAISKPDELVDNTLLKETNNDAMLAIIKAAKRNTPYSNQVQNYLGSLLSNEQTSVGDKIKIASILGKFQTEFSARILSIALLGPQIGAGELFANFMTSVTVLDTSGISGASLGDLFPVPGREKSPKVIEAIINALGETNQPLAISTLRKFGESRGPLAELAKVKANEIEASLKGCSFFPLSVFSLRKS